MAEQLHGRHWTFFLLFSAQRVTFFLGNFLSICSIFIGIGKSNSKCSCQTGAHPLYVSPYYTYSEGYYDKYSTIARRRHYGQGGRDTC